MKIEDIANCQMVKFGQKTLVADSEHTKVRHAFGWKKKEQCVAFRARHRIAPMVDQIHQNKTKRLRRERSLTSENKIKKAVFFLDSTLFGRAKTSLHIILGSKVSVSSLEFAF